MIIVLEGTDTFRSRERLRQLREAFVEKYDPSGMNVASLDGPSLKLDEFRAAVTSQGFLSSRRFVALERPFESAQKAQEGVAELIRGGVPESTILVVWTERLAAPKKGRRGSDPTPSVLASVLGRERQHESFEPLEPSAVERWITQRVKVLGGTIDRPAAALLASRTGSDLWLATNELGKLVHARPTGVITTDDVAASIAASTEANIFALTDALSLRDATRALALLEDQLASGVDLLYLLAMLARQIRILLAVSDVARHESNPATVARRLNLHPFVARKALDQVRAFTHRELLAAHASLVDLDLQLKQRSANADPRAHLEVFVLRLCQRGISRSSERPRSAATSAGRPRSVSRHPSGRRDRSS